MGNYTFEHLNSINVEHYSTLLYKTTTCLTRPATFFHSQMKKALSKATTTKLSPAKQCEKKHKEQRIKNERLSDYIYSNANLQRQFIILIYKFV